MCLRHGDVPEKWNFQDGEDFIHVWITPEGIKTQRISKKAGGNGFISHEPQTMKFFQVLDMSERQLALFPNNVK